MKCVLRPVQESDVTLLYNWRNDELVRKNSFSEGKINFEEHNTWFTSVLRNPHVFFYVLEIDENPIGQVRLNKTGNSCIISYSIAEEYRAQGYGKLILRLVENECVKKGFADSLVGYVKKNNIASQVIFKSLGYTETDEISFYRYEKIKLCYTSDEDILRDKVCSGGRYITTH